MSLLNDILRDLSQHKPVVDGAEGYDETLLQSSSLSRKKHFPWVSIVAVFIIIFLIVLAINYALHKFIVANESKSSSQAIPALVVATPIAADNLVAKELAITPAKATKQNTEEAHTENVASAELQNHINDLLQQADRALGMDRLTAPIEDNAYSYYQKILTMDSTNNDAKDGLDEIAKRYLTKAQEQLTLGNTQTAEALIQRAHFVSARFVQAHEINISESNVNENNQVSADVTPHSRVVVKTPDQAVQSEVVAETIKPFPVTEASSISVSPNAGWKDEQVAQHAQELIQKNKPLEAQTLLKNFIATAQTPILSASLLADIYIQQGNTQAASIVVDQTIYLPTDTKAKIKAQIFSINGDDAQAIALLEKNLSLADTNESYRSLLASLYHKTANYSQSIISYQRLINSFGEKPAYWLGLALAYDGLSQHKSALQAYQRLREFPQLQEQVKQYTDQRIAALRSE